MKMIVPKLAVSVTEAAAMLGIGRNTAYEAVRRGEIFSTKVGGRILVPIASIYKMLEDTKGETKVIH